MWGKELLQQERKIGRREFIAAVTVAGAGLTIAGVFPVSPTNLGQSGSVDAEILALDGDFRLGENVPTLARCQMLEVQSIHFRATKGYVRVDVSFRFTDGRMDGGAAFRMRLLALDGSVVAEQVQTEMRDRKLIPQWRGGLLCGVDRPNRPGSVEFRFPTLSPLVDISTFSLEICPAE